MPLDMKQLIEDKSGDRDYFAMVPAMLWPDIKLCSGGSDADAAAAHAQELGISLNVHDRWLYVTLKKICGEKGGQCFMSSRGLAKFAGMSAGQLSKSKANLAQAGLITIIAKKRSVKGWAIDHITVTDVWGQNIGLIRARQRSAHLVNTSECSPHEQICSPGEQIESKCSPHEQKCSPGEIEEEPIEEEPKEEEELKKKTIDPLLFDLERQTLENNGGNYADPVHAGGDDLAAEAALATLYTARGSEPPLPDSNTYKLELEKVSQVLSDNGVTDPDISRLAAQMMCKANEESPKFVNPHFRSFPSSFTYHLGVAKGQVNALSYRRDRDRELTEDSLAILADRRAAQPPLPEDDAVGQGIKAQLEQQMSRHTFQLYVVPSSFACDDGALVITALDDFGRDWLKSRLAQTIERALVSVADGPQGVVFETKEVIS